MHDDDRRLAVVETKLMRLEQDIKDIDSDVRLLRSEIKTEIGMLGAKIDTLSNTLITLVTTSKATHAAVGKSAAVALGALSFLGSVVLAIAWVYDRITSIGHHVP